MPKFFRRQVLGFLTLFPFISVIPASSKKGKVDPRPLEPPKSRRTEARLVEWADGEMVDLELLEMHGMNYGYYYDDWDPTPQAESKKKTHVIEIYTDK